MEKISSRTAIAPRFLSSSSFITDYSLPQFRTYGKNSKVIVAFKDGNVERGRILDIYTESTQDNADAEDRNIRYSYDILTRKGVIKKFGCENVLDADCLPVKEEKADDGWSLLSLSRHNKQLIREYVEVINILTHQHRKQLNKLSAVIDALRVQNTTLERNNHDLSRQLTAMNRQITTSERRKQLEGGNFDQRSTLDKLVPIGGQKRKANTLAGINITKDNHPTTKKEIVLTQRNFDIPRFHGTTNPIETRVVANQASPLPTSPIKAKMRMPDQV